MGAKLFYGWQRLALLALFIVSTALSIEAGWPKQNPNQKQRNVVYAVSNIAAGEIIYSENVEERAFKGDKIPDRALSATWQAAGHVAKRSILGGRVLTEDDLASYKEAHLQLSIRLTHDQTDQFMKIANQKGTSVSDLVRTMILELIRSHKHQTR